MTKNEAKKFLFNVWAKKGFILEQQFEMIDQFREPGESLVEAVARVAEVPLVVKDPSDLDSIRAQLLSYRR